MKKEKIKYIPCKEDDLIFKTNHKTGKLKNSHLYNADTKRMTSLIRRALIKEIKNKQNGYIHKWQLKRIRKLEYEALIIYAKNIGNKYQVKKNKNEQKNAKP